MKIEHAALWTDKLDLLKDFYTKYFGGTSNQKYSEQEKGFESYFITFESGARLELMKNDDVKTGINRNDMTPGYTHLAFSTGSRENVDKLTNRLLADGYKILGFPHETGDEYYESSAYDPDGNIIEITI
ncbi:MAG: VOC family protein [Bacillota bacterium]|nr:VOC family protein [Bacillota bacterium]